jgi:hypothetical protein
VIISSQKRFLPALAPPMSTFHDMEIIPLMEYRQRGLGYLGVGGV